MTTHPLPGQGAMRPPEYYQALAARRAREWEERDTDEDGIYHGLAPRGVVHLIGEDVPDNAHWKGWVW